MPVTIRDVAKACGVSVYTVSSTINEKGRVSPETRARILETVRRLGYDPGKNAPHRVSVPTRTIGLILPGNPGGSDPFFFRAISTANRVTGTSGYHCKLFSEEELEKIVLDEFHQGPERLGCDGLIVFCPLKNWREYTKALDAWQIPLVLVRRDTDIPGVMIVRDNDYQGMTMLMDHLFDQGHRSFIYYSQDKDTGESPDRQRALEDFLTRHRLPRGPELILNRRDLQKEYGASFAPASKGITAYSSGIAPLGVRVKSLIDSGSRPTAVVCGSDYLAVEMIKSLSIMKIRVPDEVAVTGYTNDPTADLFNPSITSVNVPVEEMIEAACDLLIHHAPGQKQAKTVLEFANKLMVRESTAGIITRGDV